MVFRLDAGGGKKDDAGIDVGDPDPPEARDDANANQQRAHELESRWSSVLRVCFLPIESPRGHPIGSSRWQTVVLECPHRAQFSDLVGNFICIGVVPSDSIPLKDFY